MAGELLIFDAAASNVDGTDPGTALNVGPGTLYGLRAFDAPAPAQTFGWAGSVDTEGALPASRKHENRQISVTVLCTTAAAHQALQGKIGKIAREGGTLKWVLPGAETVIYDLHSADTFAPRIDKLFYVRTGGYCEVQFTLLARPYGRGTAVTSLSSHAATALQPNVFTETGIKGDMTAIANLRVTNVGANSKATMIWGVQSRYYDSASTAALFLEAETATAVAAAPNAGPSGASGGGANKTMLCTDVGTGNAKEFSFTSLTHVGGFKVYARVQAPVTNTGVVNVQAGWTPPSTADTIHNDQVDLADTSGTAAEGAWFIMDLGQVEITPARLGTHSWILSIYVGSTVATDDLYVDWVALVPFYEGFGIARDFLIATGRGFEVSHDDILYQNTATKWIRPPFEGGYLRIPPAGAEARTLRMIVISMGADLNDGTVFYATDLDADTAQLVSYTPRYLVVPSP